MKNKIFQSIGFKIIFLYLILSLVNISFVVSIIFENQVDLISKNIKLESERTLAKLITSIKKFSYKIKEGKLFNIKNDSQALNQIIKLIGPYFDDYLVITEKNVILYKSSPEMEPPESLNEDSVRSMTALTFSGNEYYLRIDEKKEIMYCYIPLREFQLGNLILLVQKDVSSLNESLKNLYSQAVYVIIVVLLFHLIFAIVLFRYIINPVNLLIKGAKRLSEGDLDARISVKRKDEFYTLAETLNAMAISINNNLENLSSQIMTEKAMKNKTVNLSVKDELTGLYNHAYMLERVNEEIIRSRLKKRSMAFLIADLDHFNEINKIYGHQTGDIILKETARAIKRNCTDADIVARSGGEEFAVISPESSSESIRIMAEQIRTSIEKNIIITPDGEFSITVSIGISYADSGHINKMENYTYFQHSAETALLQAKEKGRNRVEMAI